MWITVFYFKLKIVFRVIEIKYGFDLEIAEDN